MSIVFFDTETTGLLKGESAPIGLQPYIIEFCAIKTDDELNVIDKFTTLIKPPITFEEHNDKKKGITDITGISNEMLKDQKPFIAHFPDIANFFLGAKTMVAHNLSYDRDVLFWELKRNNKLLRFPWCPEHHCTIEMSMHLEGYRLNLGKLHEKLFGEKFDGAHRAEADVEACIKCYKELVKKAA